MVFNRIHIIDWGVYIIFAVRKLDINPLWNIEKEHIICMRRMTMPPSSFHTGLNYGGEKNKNNTMKKALLCFACGALCLATITGCATLFGKQTHAVEMVSNPQGAEVYINGDKMGQTPLQLSLKADKSYTVEFRIPGKQPIIRIINNRVEAKWVVLDVLGGLIPVAIDAITGNWYGLDQNKLNVDFTMQEPTK